MGQFELFIAFVDWISQLPEVKVPRQSVGVAAAVTAKTHHPPVDSAHGTPARLSCSGSDGGSTRLSGDTLCDGGVIGSIILSRLVRRILGGSDMC